MLGAALVPLGLTRLWAGVTILTVGGYVVTAAALVPSHALDGAVLAYIVEWGVAAAVTVAVLARRGLFAPSPMTVRALAGAAITAGVLLLPESAWPVAAAASVLIVSADGRVRDLARGARCVLRTRSPFASA